MNRSDTKHYLAPILCLMLLSMGTTAQSPKLIADCCEQEAPLFAVTEVAAEIETEVAAAVSARDIDVAPAGVFQKEKIIERNYRISSHRINVDNRYGNITVHNWNRNEAKVTISIRTAERSESRAQEALERVHIDESKSGNSISFKTNIASGNSGWWSSLTGSTDDRALQIDYEIYLPKSNELALANRYGTIKLDDRTGKVAVSVSYGKLEAGRLSGRSNSLAVAYSKASMAYLNEGDVSVRYGELTLSEAEKLNLALSYSSGSTIDKVNRAAKVSLRYSGGFRIGLASTIQQADIAASYSSLEIQPAAEAAFGFNVAVSYGGFDYDSRRTHISTSSGGNTSKTYTGYWNKETGSSVNISSRYGTVQLK
jgi:hypothetical protein